MKPAHSLNDQHNTAELLDAPAFDFTTRAYADFGRQLEVQLNQLVAKWQHLAAPNALRAGRASVSLRRPR
jgi:hypothetical protein